MSDDEIKYSLIPRERLEEVNDVLLKHFFANEPLGLSLGANPEVDVKPWLSKVTKPLLDQKMSFMATKGDRIVGIMLNKVSYLCDDANIVSFREAVANLPHSFFWHILNLMDELYKDVDLFQKFGTDHMFVLHILSVNSKFSGRNIGTQLVLRSIEHAINQGFRLLSCETTGIASGKIFQKVGFDFVKEIVYENYIDVHGQKRFQNLQPHKSCIIWAKQFHIERQ